MVQTKLFLPIAIFPLVQLPVSIDVKDRLNITYLVVAVCQRG